MSMVDDALAGLAKGAMAGSVVPGIGTAIGGLAGLASSLVPHIFGEDAQPALAAAAKAITGMDDEAAQVQVLSNDPAALAAYKVQALQIAADREQARLTAQTDEITARLADTQDARKTAVDLVKAGSNISWGAPAVSVLVLVSFATMAWLVMFRAVPEGSMNLAQGLLEALKTLAVVVVSYWCGSSAGSAKKSEQLAESVPASLLNKQGAIVPADEVSG